MGLTVFAEGMGLFHKGSGGQGVAPGDVCLSPPPPPTGPAPVPYVNSLSASDLTKGSKSVKIDGEPTALEDQSEVSTSTGDEAGTQGGNVITHKTKGKGSFKLWSSTVKIEGKGVGRHGDTMGQNNASTPDGCVDFAAMTSFRALVVGLEDKPCPPYQRPSGTPNDAQRADMKANPAKATCWWPGCGQTATTPDHQPPLVVAWTMGACHWDKDKWETWARSTAATTKGHCTTHYRKQGGHMSGMYKKLEAVKAIANFLSGVAGL